MSDLVYQIVTDKIVESLESGVIPWRKPWKSSLPINAISNNEYRGINKILLSLTDYKSHRFLTWKQVSDLGGKVKEAEAKKYHVITYWKMLKGAKENPFTGELKEKNFPLLRYYRVYNVDQCEGLTFDDVVIPENELKPIEKAENLVSGYKGRPEIKEGREAYYQPSVDTVTVPSMGKFEKVEEYYSTLFHELTHSTGHEKRTNRFKNTGTKHFFGSEPYAKEELVAEIGASFLCSIVGIDNTLENSAAYIASWLKKLKNDPKLVISASAQAQRASDYIRGIEHEYTN